MTYTIIKSIKTKKRGYLTGLWVITGHALLEMAIIVFLLLGFSFVLKNMIVVRTIGVVGGIILVYFGVSIVRSVYLGSISASFLDETDEQNHGSDAPRPQGGTSVGKPSGTAPKPPSFALRATPRSPIAIPPRASARGILAKASEPSEKRGLDNPVVGGIMISMSNPYWWVWWATIGFAFMVQFNVSFKRWHELLAFFLGHEAGDLLWYLIISSLAFFGLRHLNRKVYYGVLVCCGAFMVLFGIYLGCSPFFKS